MSDANIEDFVESILADESPKRFIADPAEADVLRVAIELRATQGQWSWPDCQFVERLHQQLAGITDPGTPLVPFPSEAGPRIAGARGRAIRRSRVRSNRKSSGPIRVLAKAAAAAFLVVGTVAGTNLVGAHSPTSRLVTANAVKSAELLASSGRPLGEAYAYPSSPSWVFMQVRGSDLAGAYTCELHLTNGTTVPAGVVVVYNQNGEWAHTVDVNVSQLRSATLETSAGGVVATATFS